MRWTLWELFARGVGVGYWLDECGGWGFLVRGVGWGGGVLFVG